MKLHVQETLAELRVVEAEYLDLWRHTKAELALGNITRSIAADQCDIWGAEFVAKIIETLEGVEFLDEAWCFVHEQPCPLTPRAPHTQFFIPMGPLQDVLRISTISPGMQALCSNDDPDRSSIHKNHVVGVE